jgi:hypothetical protein
MHGHGQIVFFVNQQRYVLDNEEQTGAAIKQLAGIPQSDVLFLRRPGEDPIVRNDDVVRVKDGDHFYAQPPADYGDTPKNVNVEGVEGVELHTQPDGWVFAVFPAFPVPDAYAPREVKLLVKLPPLFPDAAPDMFYVTPILKVANGNPPRGTSTTTLLGAEWQQFSWHLKPGAWRPGISTLRDYMACVRARFERRD